MERDLQSLACLPKSCRKVLYTGIWIYRAASPMLYAAKSTAFKPQNAAVPVRSGLGKTIEVWFH